MLAQAGGGENLIDLNITDESDETPKDDSTGGDEATATDNEVKQADATPDVKDGVQRPVSIKNNSPEGISPTPQSSSTATATSDPENKQSRQGEKLEEPEAEEKVEMAQAAREEAKETHEEDNEGETKGYDVNATVRPSTSYADAVKPTTETTTAEAQSGATPAGTEEGATRTDSITAAPSATATVPEPTSSLNEGKSTAAPAQPPTPQQETTTPDKRISFPPMLRMSTSTSIASQLSEHASTSSSPGGTPGAEGSPEDSKGDKRRKRLSSIKGFVRRISDQGITRSPSYSGKAKSPMGELDQASAMAGAESSAAGTSGTAEGEVKEQGTGKEGKRKKKLSMKAKAKQ